MRAYGYTGVAIFSNLLSKTELHHLEQEFTNLNLQRPGTRHSSIPESLLTAITNLPPMKFCAEKLLEHPARLVRIIAFDKTPEINWSVPWHQDRTIAVKERHDIEGYGPWSFKGNIHHVEPPVALMNNMVTLRLHLDPCGPDNGPLEILPGSHKLGRVPQGRIQEHSRNTPPQTCIMKKGDILAMHALTIHKSDKAISPGKRRVLHLEFCSQELPNPLQWEL